MLIITIALFRR